MSLPCFISPNLFKTGKVASVEALIRWHSKTLGFVTPDRFIYLAEETNLIIPIGKWVLEQACRDFGELLAEGYPLESLSVNVSRYNSNTAI